MPIPVTECWLKIISPTRRLRIELADDMNYDITYQTRDNDHTKDWVTKDTCLVSLDFKKIASSRIRGYEKQNWHQYIPKTKREMDFLYHGTVVVDRVPFNSLMAERLGGLTLTRK